MKKSKKRIVLTCVISMIFVVGIITICNKFTKFEEVQSLENNSYETLSFTIDGEKQTGVAFPTKSSGYKVNSVTCDNGVTANWDRVSWGLVDINSNNQENIKCTVDFGRIVPVPISNVKIGDYIAYTPSNTSYTITTDLTGYTSNKTINPSELNLWRVIKKNDNGTVDVVSEYTSSKEVYFKGKTGYEKFIGTLNTIAKSYETSGVTTGSRHMGYNGQTETVTVSTATTAPWTSSTNSTNSPNESEREKGGGGDVGYLTDIELVHSAIGTIVAYPVNNDILSTYWLASRCYTYETGGGARYTGRYVKVIDNQWEYYTLYFRRDTDEWEVESRDKVRPVLTLSANLRVLENMGEDGAISWIIS